MIGASKLGGARYWPFPETQNSSSSAPLSLPAMVCSKTRVMQSFGDCPLPSLGLPSSLNLLANQTLRKGKKHFHKAQISTKFVELGGGEKPRKCTKQKILTSVHIGERLLKFPKCSKKLHLEYAFS